MHYFHCDVCDKKTMVNPPTEAQYTNEYQTIEVPHPEKPDTTLEIKMPNKKPKLCTMKRQHHLTGEMEDIQVQEHKDLFARAYIVSLNVGPEGVQRDFCKECLAKVMPELQALWDKLAKISPMNEE